MLPNAMRPPLLRQPAPAQRISKKVQQKNLAAISDDGEMGLMQLMATGANVASPLLLQ